MAPDLATIGVTSATSLLGCRRRTELDQCERERERERDFSAPALLGDLCHATLEIATESRGILAAEWETAIAEAWSEAEDEIGKRYDGVVISRLPSYDLTKARTRGVAQRLRELLTPLGADVELICEAPMSALEGRLVGRPDLVARSGEAHWIIDYKTGGALERATQSPRAAYSTQLQLYAALEHQRSGSWPKLGVLLSFTQGAIEVSIDPDECTTLLAALSEALAAFDQQAPGPQPAAPSAETCQWCAHPTRCEPVWEQSEESWAPRVTLVEGHVLQVVTAEIGSTTLVLEVERGTLARGKVAIRSQASDGAADLRPGSHVQASGLSRRGDRTYALTDWGALREMPS